MKDQKDIFFYDNLCVMKGGKETLAKEFINQFLTPDVNTEYNKVSGGCPTVTGATVEHSFAPFVPKPEDWDQYLYNPDWHYIIAHADEWNSRFESEILPIIKANM
jgi:ABC-type glycerol-3-phosphate transport system substrate-binding protein